jgi:hypothetical protein
MWMSGRSILSACRRVVGMSSKKPVELHFRKVQADVAHFPAASRVVYKFDASQSEYRRKKHMLRYFQMLLLRVWSSFPFSVPFST